MIKHFDPTPPTLNPTQRLQLARISAKVLTVAVLMSSFSACLFPPAKVVAQPTAAPEPLMETVTEDEVAVDITQSLLPDEDWIEASTEQPDPAQELLELDIDQTLLQEALAESHAS